MQNTVCNSQQVWDQAAAAHEAILFQSYEWGKLMEELPDTSFHPIILKTDNGQAVYVPVFEQNGNISGNMIGYGGPFLEGAISFEWLQGEIKALFGREMSRLLLPYDQATFIEELGPGWEVKTTHMLTLPDTFEELWTSCSGKARTAVRYAEKESVTIRQIGQKELNEFYDLYKAHSAAIGAQYVLRLSFFQRLLENLSSRVFWLGAFLEQKLISSSIFLYDRSHFYYWQNVNSLDGKKAQASYLLMRDALQFAINAKLRWADFGYSHSKEIARPKRYWGAEEKRCLQFTAAE